MMFEAHITLPREEAPEAQTMASFSRWSFSQIDGDPLFGKGVWCYLTAHSEDYEALLKDLHLRVECCKQHGMHPKRAKIESIQFDEVYS